MNRQEFVIGGYTEAQGERIGFGALLLGYYEDDDFIYHGKVGTGFDDETLRRLSRRLSSLERETPAFAEDDLPTDEAHWVEPQLVAQIGSWSGRTTASCVNLASRDCDRTKIPRTWQRRRPNRD